MNKRNVITVLAVVLCTGAVWRVTVQRQELVRVRAEQRRLITLSDPASQAPTTQNGGDFEAQKAANPAEAVPPELLQLRAEVQRLTRRLSELSAVSKEAEQLQAQLQNSRTNSAAGVRLPPGYLRKSQAQNVGYNTPEDTMQTFLWALQNRDLTNLTLAFKPETAERIGLTTQPELGFIGRANPGLRMASAIPGLRIVSRRQEPDGAFELEVEFAPGLQSTMRLEAINGQWKIAGEF